MSIQSSDMLKNIIQQQPSQYCPTPITTAGTTVNPVLSGLGFSTLVIHSGQEPEQWESNSMVPPIVSSTIFKRCKGTPTTWSSGGLQKTPRWAQSEYVGLNIPRTTIGSGAASGLGYYDSNIENVVNENNRYYETYGTQSRDNVTFPYLHGKLEYPYGRNTNPTRAVLEKCLNTLENAKYAVALSSGTAALTVLASLLESGQHVLLIDEVYVDTKRFFKDCAKRMGIESSYVDMNDIEETSRSVLPNTRMVWIETPTNPSLKIVDIKRVIDAVRRKQPNVIVVVDNTLATPMFQRPLDLGADVVLHSLSKYLNGHMDVVMGALMTNDEQIFRQIRKLQDILGVAPSPFDCNQVNRGIKTFPLRMRQHMTNAFKLANYLQDHPLVSQVIYPGLRSHPQHDIFNRQMKGFGGVLCIKVKGGPREIEKFLDALKVVSCAESLGGYASLIEQPDREFYERGLESRYGDNFLRISVGIEDIDDIINDINQAFNKMNFPSSTI